VPAGATAEEVAAIVAALAAIDAEERALAAAAAAEAAAGDDGRIDAWVQSARFSGRGAGFTRGPWRLAGRLSRRHRA
jgi:predicted LPLAT superfamily acyltransferase